MSSMQNLAYAFIRSYFAEWGVSPTLGEMAAHLRTSRKRAHEIRKALVQKGIINFVPGQARGMMLIDRTEELSENEVLARLLAAGWTVGDGNRIIYPPGDPTTGPLGVTENGLFLLPLLDHLPPADQMGTGIDGRTKRRGAAGSGRGVAAPSKG